MSDLIIRQGDTVIFDVNGGEKIWFVELNNRAKVKLGKSFCSAHPLVGCPYGSLFGLAADGKSIERIEHIPSSEWDAPADDDPSRNNSKLVDGNVAHQKLTQQDIEAMKASGAAGEQIIEALTNNSATFATKTEFAQEKYKRKKAKKHVQIACARRPTAAALCMAYYARNPARIGYLRVDSLALLLTVANVGAGAKILTLETCAGLVTGAVAERLGGSGQVCAAHVSHRQPGQEAMRSFNLSSEIRGTISSVSLLSLLEQRLDQQRRRCEDATHLSGEGEGAAPLKEGNENETSPAPETEPAADVAAFSGCIIACNALTPIEALEAVLPLLTSSASFAVHAQALQPLAEALDRLRGSGFAVNLMLHDVWWREYQVLPKRTRPTMSMDHGGGYILSGVVTQKGSENSAYAF